MSNTERRILIIRTIGWGGARLGSINTAHGYHHAVESAELDDGWYTVTAHDGRTSSVPASCVLYVRAGVIDSVGNAVPVAA